MIRTCFHTIPDAAKETTQSSLAGGLATLLESSQRSTQLIRTCFHTIPDAAKETTQSSLAGGLATLLESSQRSTQLIRTCFHTIPDAAKETTQSSLAGGLATLLESSQLFCQASEAHPEFASRSNEARLGIHFSFAKCFSPYRITRHAKACKRIVLRVSLYMHSFQGWPAWRTRRQGFFTP